MLTNYYTLKALMDEWRPWLEGAQIFEAYTQNRGSLILVFRSGEDDIRSMNISVQSPHRHVFMYAGSNRSRKNTTDLLEEIVGRTVIATRIAERDRLLHLELDSGDRLYLVPYGPRANVLLVGPGGDVKDVFRGSMTKAEVPDVRSAPVPDGPESFAGVTVDAKGLSRALPLFPRPLAEELAHRAGPTAEPADVFAAHEEMESELADPCPRYYPGPDILSMIRLRHHEEASAHRPEEHGSNECERFDSVGEAVRVVARKRLSEDRFESRFDPLQKLLENRRDQAERSLRRVEQELEKPSRADRYEKWGHILMALPHQVPTGAERVTLPDIIEGGEDQVIKLKSGLSAIENAERYYDRARSTRQSRAAADRRLDALRNEYLELKDLTAEFANADTPSDLADFEEKHAAALLSLRAAPDDPDAIPYRRYRLDHGYEVWVGRNAKQNDQLTLKDARKWDWWLHARGVPGSHTVLRLPRRDEKPPRSILERAAAIAAFHSKARTSAMAPVIVTQKKYVRKPRKSPPGSVAVEREEVIMIEPSVPEGM